MNNKKLQEFMKQIDKTKRPKHWIKFIHKNVVSNNLILKCGNRAFCTHCQKYFDKTVNVHSYNKVKCEWCGNKYYVKNCNIKDFAFLKDIAFYVKINDKIVLRIFEIESKYDYKTRSFKQNLQEFARFVPGIGVIINNSVSFYMWNQKIWHNEKIKNWHLYTGHKLIYEMPIYPYNKKYLFKNTPLAYAPIDEFKKEYSYYNDFQIMQFATYESFELLWKMGLHELSLHARSFNKKGCFQKRFGVPKSFLKFMVEHNIDYYDYRILKLLPEPNMKLIQEYRYYDYNYLSFIKKQGFIKNPEVVKEFYPFYSELKTICKYTSLKKFLNYKKGIENIHIYTDYLEMATKLGYSIKSKKRLFPYQLKAWHDKLSKKLKIIDDMDTQFGVYLRYLELSKYTFNDDTYIIFPAPSVDEFKTETIQQRNCVANQYVQPYIKRETEIYFIRKLENPTQSFITLEYNNNHVAQKELPNHSKKFTENDLQFIDKWIGFRQFTLYREKYNKTNIKVKKYDLNKMVA